MTDSRTAYRPKIGSTSWLATSRPTKVKIADGEAEDQLAADPLAEDALDRPDHRPHVEAPARRERPVELRHQHHPVVEQVGDPDRQDQVAEHDADQAAGTGQDRQQERQVDRDRPPPGCPNPARMPSIQSRIAGGIWSLA